jgi:hypothetical protein
VNFEFNVCDVLQECTTAVKQNLPILHLLLLLHLRLLLFLHLLLLQSPPLPPYYCC